MGGWKGGGRGRAGGGRMYREINCNVKNAIKFLNNKKDFLIIKDFLSKLNVFLVMLSIKLIIKPMLKSLLLLPQFPSNN